MRQVRERDTSASDPFYDALAAASLPGIEAAAREIALERSRETSPETPRVTNDSPDSWQGAGDSRRLIPPAAK